MDNFHKKIELLISELDDVMEDYRMLELLDCETELSDAREAFSEVLYKISRL